MTNHAELCGSHMCPYSRLILRMLSVRVLRRNVPRDQMGRGKPDKKNTRVREKRSRRDERDVTKKKGMTSPFISCDFYLAKTSPFQNVNSFARMIGEYFLLEEISREKLSRGGKRD